MTGEVRDLEKRLINLKSALLKLQSLDPVLAPRCAELIDLLDDFLEHWKEVQAERPEEAD